jgi:WD40 repeat protein
VLIAWADPANGNWLGSPEIASEVEIVTQALQSLPASHFSLKVLPRATQAALQREMMEFRPHLLHFLGHGAFPGAPNNPPDVISPSVVLHAWENYGYTYLEAEALSTLCAQCDTQIVFLNCCWGAHSEPHVRGLSRALAESGRVPVVIAHQAEIPQFVSPTFALHLYRGLASVIPIEDSIGEFRREQAPDLNRAQWLPYWGLPTLSMNCLRGTVFQSEKVDAYPVDFRPLFQRHRRFCGREFLEQRMEEFRASHSSGVWLIEALPGLGKTAFLVEQVRRRPGAVHFFFRATAGIRDPEECGRSLAAALMAQHGILERDVAQQQTGGRERLEAVFRLVSSKCAEKSAHQWILLDALDEAGTTSGGLSVVDLIPAELPRGIYLLAASRPGPMAEALKRRGVQTFFLDSTSEANLADLEGFCKSELAMLITTAGEHRVGRLARDLAEHAKGNFLVIENFLRANLTAPSTAIERIEEAAQLVTKDVNNAYKEFFERARRDMRRDDLNLLCKVLGAFISAFGPVTDEQVKSAFQLTSADWIFAQDRLAQFLERGVLRQEDRGVSAYQLYHETFREYLVEELASDIPYWHKLWADYCLRWRNLVSRYGCLYALRNGPGHLLGAEDWGRLQRLMLNFEFLAAKIEQIGIFALLGDFVAAKDLPSLETVHRILDRNSLHLRGNSSLLFQQLHNSADVKVFSDATMLDPWIKMIACSESDHGYCGLLRTLVGHAGNVTSVSVSGNGDVVASGSDDQTVKLWDARTGRLLHSLEGHGEQVTSVSLSSDGKLVASGSKDLTVKLWEVEEGRLLVTLKGHTHCVTSVALSKDGKLVASGSKDLTVKLWKGRTGRLLQNLETYTRVINSVALSGDGEVLASGSDFFDLSAGVICQIMSGEDEAVDDRGFGRPVNVWAASIGRLLYSLQAHRKDVNAVALSRDGEVLASGSRDRTVNLWEARNGRLLHRLEGHTDSVSSVALSADGKLVASGSQDHTVKIWEGPAGRLVRTLEGHTHPVSSVALSEHGDVVASGSWDRTVKLWDMRINPPRHGLGGHTSPVSSVAISGNGTLVASGSWDRTVKLWEARTGRPLHTLEGHAGYVRSVGLSGDGEVVASGSDDQTVKLWEAGSSRLVHTLEGHTSPVWSVAFSGDGEVVASGSGDWTVKLWETRTGRLLHSMKGHKGLVRSVALSGDGQFLASSSYDRSLKVWDTRSGQMLHSMEGHKDLVRSVALSWNGRVVVSGSGDRTVKVWDVESGRLLHSLGDHTRQVTSVALSWNGEVVASVSTDRSIQVWSVLSGRRIAFMPIPVEPQCVHFEKMSDRVFCVSAAAPDNRVMTYELELMLP